MRRTSGHGMDAAELDAACEAESGAKQHRADLPGRLKGGWDSSSSRRRMISSQPGRKTRTAPSDCPSSPSSWLRSESGEHMKRNKEAMRSRSTSSASVRDCTAATCLSELSRLSKRATEGQQTADKWP